MSEDLLKKKVLIDKEPVFNHTLSDVEEAIGIKGIVENIATKLQELSQQTTTTSPSKAIEFIYAKFSKVELAFLMMHSMSKEIDTDLEEKGEEAQ